jgi:hypothetical protein
MTIVKSIIDISDAGDSLPESRHHGDEQMTDSSKNSFFCQSSERTDLFVDGVYLASMSRRLRWSADYKKVLEIVRSHSLFGQALFFSVVKEVESSGATQDAAAALQRLIQFVGHSGYSVDTRWISKRGSNKSHDRFTAAVNIALKMEECSRQAGHIILLSGDSALIPAVERAQRRGCRLTVVASEEDVNAAQLRRQSSDFIPLESLKEVLQRTSKGERRG